MKNKKPFWALEASKGKANEGNLLLYGVISSESWWGDEVTPKQFKADLDALGDIKTLNVFINSPGGDVFAGSAIYSMLKRCQAEKIVYIDGIAASMASMVAMAGDKIIMPKNAMLMVHEPWGVCMGNAKEMRTYAGTLEQISTLMVSAYADKTGKADGDIRAVMDAETWFTAEEAVAAGWADELEDTKQVAACASGDLFYFGAVAVNPSQFRSFPVEKITVTAASQVTDPVIDPPTITADVPLEIYQAKIRMNERRYKTL